jgi:predicted neutral ceramidase superfamily lipid hydrolase
MNGLYELLKMIYDIIANLFAFVSVGCLMAGIVVSSVKMPITMSIIWAVWFISTILFMLCMNAMSQQIPPQVLPVSLPQQPIRDIPMQTVVVQHPDGTLSVDSKANP